MNRNKLSDYTTEELKNAFGRALTGRDFNWKPLRKEDLIDCIMKIDIDERLRLLGEPPRAEKQDNIERTQHVQQVFTGHAEQSAPRLVQLRPNQIPAPRVAPPMRMYVPRVVPLDQQRPNQRHNQVEAMFRRMREEHTGDMFRQSNAGTRRNRDDDFRGM
jgi:hypothetical protein